MNDDKVNKLILKQEKISNLTTAGWFTTGHTNDPLTATATGGPPMGTTPFTPSFP